MPTALRQRIAYDSRHQSIVFVAVPDQRGRYVLTHRCVVQTHCSTCKSQIGEPCKGPLGYRSSTHYARRAAARDLSIEKLSDIVKADDVADALREV